MKRRKLVVYLSHLHIWPILIWPPPLPLIPQAFHCWLFLEYGSFILKVLSLPTLLGGMPQEDAQDRVESGLPSALQGLEDLNVQMLPIRTNSFVLCPFISLPQRV